MNRREAMTGAVAVAAVLPYTPPIWTVIPVGATQRERGVFSPSTMTIDGVPIDYDEFPWLKGYKQAVTPDEAQDDTAK
jgi:hypothetical protein